MSHHQGTSRSHTFPSTRDSERDSQDGDRRSHAHSRRDKYEPPPFAEPGRRGFYAPQPSQESESARRSAASSGGLIFDPQPTYISGENPNAEGPSKRVIQLSKEDDISIIKTVRNVRGRKVVVEELEIGPLEDDEAWPKQEHQTRTPGTQPEEVHSKSRTSRRRNRSRSRSRESQRGDRNPTQAYSRGDEDIVVIEEELRRTKLGKRREADERNASSTGHRSRRDRDDGGQGSHRDAYSSRSHEFQQSGRDYRSSEGGRR